MTIGWQIFFICCIFGFGIGYKIWFQVKKMIEYAKYLHKAKKAIDRMYASVYYPNERTEDHSPSLYMTYLSDLLKLEQDAMAEYLNRMPWENLPVTEDDVKMIEERALLRYEIRTLERGNRFINRMIRIVEYWLEKCDTIDKNWK